MTEQNIEDDVVDVEPYEGPPDYDVSKANENGDQEDEVDLGGGLGFFSRAAAPVRNTQETLEWYATHQSTGQIGFDPDGMCLKVCRTARNIGPKHLTAKQAQDATPEQYRVRHVRDLRKGMVLYYDDPDDSNRSGHIVTMIGRVAGFDKDDLGDVLVETNSVKENQLVVVRGDYFFKNWGDPFQFGAAYLNGVAFPSDKKFDSLIEKFQDPSSVYHLNLLVRAGKDRPAAKSVYDAIITQVNLLPDNPELVRVREFKNKVRSKEQILDLRLLDQAVADRGNRDGKIKRKRDEIRRLINSLPDV